MEGKKKIRVLLAKPGLDGHDRGAKVVAQALRDAGMEVIYTGRHQMPEEIVTAATQEDVDVIGLSILSGAHLTITKRLIELMKQKGILEIPIVLGGIIPEKDIPKLKNLGVKGVFRSGTSLTEICDFITRCGRDKQN